MYLKSYVVYCLLDSLVTILSAQDKGSFCIFHILNEILLYLQLLDKFLVGNHCPIFYEDYAIKCTQYV